MTRSNFFKTLVGVAAVGSVKPEVKQPEPLTGRDRPITPEDLENYINERILQTIQISGKFKVSGRDLVAVYDSKSFA